MSNHPANAERCLNIHLTSFVSYGCQMDVKTTFYAHWDVDMYRILRHLSLYLTSFEHYGRQLDIKTMLGAY